MTYRTTEAGRVFVKLKIVTTSSNHHIKGFIYTDEGRRLFPPIYFNKGRKDIPPKIAEKMRKCLLLDRTEFEALMRCRMSRESYFMHRR